MGIRSVPAALAGILPWILSALWPAFTPSQALLAALALRHGPPRRQKPREIFVDFLALAAPPCVLHQLRPDAPWLVGAAILLAGLLLELARARPRGAQSARCLIAHLLAGPISLTFFCQLAELQPPALLEHLDPWTLAAAPPEAAVRYDIQGETWYAPARVEPWPLSWESESGAHQRGLLLLALICAAALWLQCSRNWVAVLALLAAACGPLGLRSAPRTVYLDPGDGGSILVVEISGDYHGSAAWSWDPLRDAPPPGIQAHLAPHLPDPSSPDLAWQERHPLRAPLQEGEPDALRLVSWYAEADQPAGAVRWSLRGDGTLTRLRLPR